MRNNLDLAPVSSLEVEEHIDATNTPGGPRDAWAGIGSEFNSLKWGYGAIPIAELPDVFPASKKDVKRYARHAGDRNGKFPAIVISVANGRVTVLDGAHRLAAARLLGRKTIDAYVGFSK